MEGRRVEQRFGRFLRAELARQGLTMTRFAELVGVRPATVSRWVSGQRSPSRADSLRIASALDVSPGVVAGALHEHLVASRVSEVHYELGDLREAAASLRRQLTDVEDLITRREHELAREEHQRIVRHEAQELALRVLSGARKRFNEELLSHPIVPLDHPFFREIHARILKEAGAPEESVLIRDICARLEEQLLAALDAAIAEELPSAESDC